MCYRGGTSLTQLIKFSRIARANAGSNYCLIDLTDMYRVIGVDQEQQGTVSDDCLNLIQVIGMDIKPRMEV